MVSLELGPQKKWANSERMSTAYLFQKKHMQFPNDGQMANLDN
jgi:hypothetical protein